MFKSTKSSAFNIPEVTISLTSYAKRFPYLFRTLQRLLYISKGRAAIEVHLFANDFDLLNSKLLGLRKRGIKYIKHDKDLKVFLKLSSVDTFNGTPIITVDDDVFYQRDFLEKLIDASNNYPGTVIGLRGFKPIVKKSCEFDSYRNWKAVSGKDTNSNCVFLTGVGGILYPPEVIAASIIKPEEGFNICPNNDDLYLYFKLHQREIPIFALSSKNEPLTWPNSQDGALWKANVSLGKNDQYLKDLTNYFGLPKHDS